MNMKTLWEKVQIEIPKIPNKLYYHEVEAAKYYKRCNVENQQNQIKINSSFRTTFILFIRQKPFCPGKDEYIGEEGEEGEGDAGHDPDDQSCQAISLPRSSGHHRVENIDKNQQGCDQQGTPGYRANKINHVLFGLIVC